MTSQADIDACKALSDEASCAANSKCMFNKWGVKVKGKACSNTAIANL